MSRIARRLGSMLCVSAALAVSACDSDSPVTEPLAAPSASDPACAALLERLPSSVLDRRSIAASGTGSAAWGDPAIVLQCGVEPPVPSTDSCVTVDGVDWLITGDQSAYRFVTYGRVPAVSVSVPLEVDRTTAPGSLAQLARAVEPLTVERSCVGAADTTPPG